MRASVGQPLDLAIWVADAMAPNTRGPAQLNVTWVKYQGPVVGAVTITPATQRVAGTGLDARATATFSQPGQYLLRVRVDNWTVGDSDGQRLCCWTNGYVPVTVQ